MAEQCNSCGAELFTGQQFCRACGAPTRQFSSEELPTQILPHQQQERPLAPAPLLNTAPLSAGRATSDPVYRAGYQQYQPPAAQQPQQPTLPIGVAPRRRSRGWLYAVLGLLVFVLGATFLAALFFVNRPHRVVRMRRPNVAAVPPVPAVPPGGHVEADEQLMEDEGAEVSGGQTVITKTYPLAKNGSFSLHNISGDITIEGWDEQQAEVMIIKRGGSEQERAGLKIMREESANRLVFNTMPEKHRGVQEVQYRVKLPRNLRELEVVSNNSNIDLSNVDTASISINVQRGNIELEDVSGTINSRTTKGSTKVVLNETAQSAPQIFNGISGNIELELAPGVNAELKAETISGNIEIDKDFGIEVEKRMIGQQAIGRLGKGGQPIVVKTVSGNIKIKS
jgi:hypothetical protein